MGYSTGNPIGSADPRDLYDNAENFDEAVNDRGSTEWTDRFGKKRKTWGGIEQGVDQIVGARGPSSPGIGVRLRTADEPASITASLADGEIGSRPAAPEGFTYASDVSTGAYYTQSIPGIVARRAMTPLHPNDGTSFSVHIYTGVKGSSNPTGAMYRSGVAWYDRDRNALTDGHISLFNDGVDLTENNAYQEAFTYGGEGSGSDLMPPAGAVYAIPFYEFYAGSGYSAAFELSVEKVNEAIERANNTAAEIAATAISAYKASSVSGEFHNSNHDAGRQPIIMNDDGKGVLNLDEDGFLDIRYPAEFHNDARKDAFQITDEDGAPVARFANDGGLIRDWISEFYNTSTAPTVAYVDDNGRAVISWDQDGRLAVSSSKRNAIEGRSGLRPIS